MTNNKQQKAILIGLINRTQDEVQLTEYLDELEFLALTFGAVAQKRFTQKMEKAIYYTHLVSVISFLLIYLIKTSLLVANKNENLKSFSKMFKVPEMIVSFLFLGTGVYMITQIPEIKSFMIIKLVCVFASIPIAIIGFKKSNKILAVFSLLLIIGSYGLAEMSKKQKSGIQTTSVSGQEIYSANCTSCHGNDGKKGLMGATDLSASALDENAAMEIIKNGKGRMGAFGKDLSDEQISAVTKYVMTLK